MAAEARGPLGGVTVIELAHIMAGPACGMLLADFGADVIKVERIPGGDDSRSFATVDIEGESPTFMMMNRNKRGIAVDLKTEGGKKVLRRLLKTADVVIENYRRGTMERLGLGYDRLKEANPGLVYCEISGFGRTGPYADRGGFDLIAQGMSGLMSITGEGPDRPPVKAGAPITDITAGILAAFGVLAALLERQHSGLGQRVDTSLFEAGITHTFWQSALALASGVSPGPLGTGSPVAAPYQAFPTADGWITVGGANQANWRKLLGVLETPELGEDPRFGENPDRMENIAALEEILNEHFIKRTSAEWLDKLEAAGVPAGPVMNVGEMHQDPQTLARKMVVEVDHRRAGKVKTLGPPVKLSRTPASVRSAAPVLGQHTAEVLTEYGYSAEEIDQLADAGAIIVG
ncbi:MAG: CoA transferase [Proteobacteria bacterium]|nr:CoA transferase [Pseudomonadota bacterium]